MPSAHYKIVHSLSQYSGLGLPMLVPTLSFWKDKDLPWVTIITIVKLFIWIFALQFIVAHCGLIHPAPLTTKLWWLTTKHNLPGFWSEFARNSHWQLIQHKTMHAIINLLWGEVKSLGNTIFFTVVTYYLEYNAGCRIIDSIQFRWVIMGISFRRTDYWRGNFIPKHLCENSLQWCGSLIE